jgi:hypothetical protein
MKRDLDFTTRMVEMQGIDRLSRGVKRGARELIKSDPPSLIPSSVEYIRSTRIKEKKTTDILGFGLEGISRPHDSFTDVPTEAQVRAFEELNHK